MKKCAYCNDPIPKEERKFFRMPVSIMDDAELVCAKCMLEIKPELIGYIGVK